MRSGELSVADARSSLRRHLLELVRAADGMHELWFACMDNLDEGLRSTLESSPPTQGFLDHFLWDWFKKYSEARPIVRAARHFEPTDLRLANHLDGWGLAPWEPWEVVGGGGRSGTWSLRQLGSGREVDVLRTFGHHEWDVGDGLLARILQHGGHEFSGLSVTRFEGSSGVTELRGHWNRLAKKHGFSPTTRLRPDIHNDIWLAIHEDLLALVLSVEPREEPLGSRMPATPAWDAAILDRPQPDLAGQTPRQAAGNELGRHRLRKWLDGGAVGTTEAAKIREALSL